MATKANIVIDQGSTFSIDLDLTDTTGDYLDLSGYTSAAQLRKWYTSSSYTDFSTSINATASVITLSLTSTQTAALTAGRYVYDVELTSGTGEISRIVEGIATVTPEVTK